MAVVTGWRDSALCAQVGGDWFFPDKGGTTLHAKRVCAACPVRPECLRHALDVGEDHGVWGGLAPRERRALRLRAAA